MCGIAGIIGLERGRAEPLARAMERKIAHRGPDDSHIEYLGNPECPLVFIHRRLSILDTSSAGRQPMSVSADGKRVWISYNGEVFNYKEIHKDLGDPPLVGGSDTEVMLHAYLRWGISCVERFNGMFAFSLYDERTGQIFLVRDRLGVKPLYFARLNGGGLAFASELRSVLEGRAHLSTELDRRALHSFLAQGCVTEPHTIFQGIELQEPGTILECKASGEILSKKKYWSLAEQASRPVPQEPYREVRERLQSAVQLRLRSDVPLAVFLSSGIDSTAIASLAKRVHDGPIETVTVGFPDIPEVDESTRAEAISRELGTRNHRVQITNRELIGFFERYLGSMDQPTIDGFNTFFVSHKTAELGFKVALSGLGGDELFAGYASFTSVPAAIRLSPLLKAIHPFKGLVQLTNQMVQTRALEKIGELLGRPCDLLSFYLLRREVFLSSDRTEFLEADPGVGSAGLSEQSQNALSDYLSFPTDRVNQISALELSAYMRNMLLRDSDVFSMAHALELRVPFLDYRLVELALSIPGLLKVENGKIKPLLVRALGDVLPPSTLITEKKGFAMPWRHWLLGEFKPMVEDLLGPNSKATWKNLGMQAEPIERLWRRFEADDQRVSPSQILALLILSRYVRVQASM